MQPPTLSLPAAFATNRRPPPPPLTLPLPPGRHYHHRHHCSPFRRATLLSSHRPITALPSRRLIAPAGCCVASLRTALSSSSHRTALSLSCSGWLLHCLPSHRPLVLSLCLPLVLSSSYHCAALSLSHLTGWLLRRLSLYRLLVVLSLRRSLVVLLRLLAASTLVAPPSRPHVMPPPRPLIVLSLRCPLVVSSCWLVVASPFVAPPSLCPLTAPPSHRLAPAGCCVASRHTALTSSRHASLSSFLRPITAPPSCCLISPAGCCVASRRTALSSSSRSAALSSSCAGWLLRQLLSRHPLVLTSCHLLVLSSSYHCADLSLSHCDGWLLHRLSLHRPLVVL
jgi:hypothetical protein